VKQSVAVEAVRPRLTGAQKRGFWTAWAGWALDGMDSVIYALVMVPALRELLPNSGIPATTANIGYYGSLLFALFLIGWYKAKATTGRPAKSGAQMLVIGIVSALAGFGIAYLVGAPVG